MEDPSSKLIDELRSLLDEATILSISSDYDLSNPQEFAAARQVLLTISKDVEAEEATGFNPSGLGIDAVVDISPSNQDGGAEAPSATTSDVKSLSGLTTTTESSIPLSITSAGSLKVSNFETPEPFHVSIFDGLSDSEKEYQLAQMFVSLKPIDIKLSLQKSKGDASLAIDELLNLQWLEQTGQRLKGVDGFYVSDDDSRNKKKKGSRKKKKAAKVSSSKVTLPKYTSREAVESEAAHGDLQSSDPHLLSDIQEETNKFPWIPRNYIKSAIEICPTQEDAVDVIRILAEYFEKPLYMKLDVPYSVAASDLDVVSANTSESINMSNLKQPLKPTTNMQSSALDSRQQIWGQPSNLEAATAASRRFATSRDHSFTSATAAFKKGKSNPLFRQAGAYYVERGREQAENYQQASKIEASYLVDQKSTENMIDLHGVTVLNGVEIALERVRQWWESLGEERSRKAKQGFTVVTGLGRHSPDGKSPLRTNVFKALVSDGWKVEVLTGSYLITGRRERL
ncbi:hypothetical protein AAE478_007789 [Parahypoxylon ruwenzoriense]